MAETKIFIPVPLDTMRVVSTSENRDELDIKTTEFLRKKYSITSASYYMLHQDVPWIAVSKSVKNQMTERAIEKVMFEWYEPGLDLIDVYPQMNNSAAFAVSMLKGTKQGAEKLVGFYVLSVFETIQSESQSESCN